MQSLMGHLSGWHQNHDGILQPRDEVRGMVEPHATHEGLCAIQNRSQTSSEILVCADNQSALKTLSAGNPTNLEFARQALLTVTSKQLLDGWSISRLWTPAHCRILGNEEADTLAKLGVARPRRPRSPGSRPRYSASRARTGLQDTPQTPSF